MSDYRRFISYLYEYKDGKKTYNRGFLKLESKGGIVKLEVHIKDSALTSSIPVQIFGFTRDGDKLPGILLGDTQSATGSIGCCLRASSQNLDGSGVSLSDLNGIILLCGSTLCYASAWDDLPINPDAFQPSESKVNSDNESADSASGEEEIKQASSEEPSLETEEIKRNPAESQVSPVSMMDFIPDPPYTRWEKIMDRYESINPFSDGSVTESVRLDLKDLPSLRKERWLIGNNPLILHAYSEHHHLLLGKMENNENIVYIFGVPGTYTPKEKFMADMYGFPYFKASGPITHGAPRFGYWYRVID